MQQPLGQQSQQWSQRQPPGSTAPPRWPQAGPPAGEAFGGPRPSVNGPGPASNPATPGAAATNGFVAPQGQPLPSGARPASQQPYMSQVSPPGGPPSGGPAGFTSSAPNSAPSNGMMHSPALHQQMGQIDLNAPPMGPPDVQPAKTKRSQRAYHQDEAKQTSFQQPTFPPVSAAQAQAYQHQLQQQTPPAPVPSSHSPHPYANAPPASGPPPPEEAPNSIRQPPHSAGQRLPGPKSRIDPNQIPSPIDVLRLDQERFNAEPFMTCSRAAVPQSMTDFVAVDQGNCNPRFLRLSTYTLPQTDDLANASHLPLGMVIQPFAQLKPEEGTVPTVDFGDDGPPRCEHCRGYINPWCHFVDGGQRFVCNLCGGTSPVSADYFCHLDVSGRRLDLDQRAELCRGSVDFLVPRVYWAQQPTVSPMASIDAAATGRATPTAAGSNAVAREDAGVRPPQPMHFVFAIDVSWQSAQSGVIREVARSLKFLLFGADEDESTSEQTDAEQPKAGTLPPGSRVALITFDRTPDLEHAEMMVVPDIEDMFVPLHEGLLVDPVECKTPLVALLDGLETMFGGTSTLEAALGGGLRAALVLLNQYGGQLNLFQASLPTLGPGTLRHREDNKLYGTDKERTLFIPQDPFYRTVSEECAEAGLGVNLFLFPSQYIDVASLGVLAGLTGGETFFHPRFDPVRDGARLRSEIVGIVSRETGYNATMRIRCSNGLRISDHFGNFYQRNNTDLEFGTLDADKAIGALVKHESKLDEKSDAYFQCAVLYTSASGQRRVRCHNMAIPVSSKLGDVFRLADMDTTIALVAKESITQSLTKSLRDVRDHLTDTCVKILLSYRKHCASATSPGQLILPESYKLFPVFALSLMKTKALKGGPVASDVRTFYMRIIKSIGVYATIELLYPRMFALHRLEKDDALPDERGNLKVPGLMRTSYARMEVHGAYLIENGETAIIWLGGSVSPLLLEDLYGVGAHEEIDTRMTALPKLPTHLSTQVNNLLTHLESKHRHRRLPVLIARQHMDGTEYEFSSMLVEDSHSDALSYVDYLCSVHKRIQESLSGEKREEGDAAASLWRGAW